MRDHIYVSTHNEQLISIFLQIGSFRNFIAEPAPDQAM